MSKALVIIDIQNDYFKGGAMELENPMAASENAKKLLEKFRSDKKEFVELSGSSNSYGIPNTYQPTYIK